MNTQLAATPRLSRASIMAKLVTVMSAAGMEFTNIEAALGRAGFSQRDITEQFGSNRELLLAMVMQLSDSMAAPLNSVSSKTNWRLCLLEFGERVSKTYSNSHLRTLYRIAITESIRHTGLERDFYEAGPGRLTQRLASFIASAQVEGAIRGDSPQMMASHFLSLLRVDLDGADAAPPHSGTPASADHVRSVVNVFSGGIGGGARAC